MSISEIRINLQDHIWFLFFPRKRYSAKSDTASVSFFKNYWVSWNMFFQAGTLTLQCISSQGASLAAEIPYLWKDALLTPTAPLPQELCSWHLLKYFYWVSVHLHEVLSAWRITVLAITLLCHLPLAALGAGYEPKQTFGVIWYRSPCFTGN